MAIVLLIKPFCLVTFLVAVAVVVCLSPTENAAGNSRNSKLPQSGTIYVNKITVKVVTNH